MLRPWDEHDLTAGFGETHHFPDHFGMFVGASRNDEDPVLTELVLEHLFGGNEINGHAKLEKRIVGALQL
jgi:hypothetical protein